VIYSEIDPKENLSFRRLWCSALELPSKDNTINLLSFFVFDKVQIDLRTEYPAFAELKLVTDRGSEGVLPFASRIFSTDSATKVQAFVRPEMDKKYSKR
jgi:hypothetical protein